MPQEKSQKLSEIVAQLSSLTKPASLDELHSILGDLEIERADVEDFCLFNPLCYSRNPVAANENFELLCICWLPGQSSLIHDHTGSACGVRVITGAMTETIFERTTENRARPVRTNHYDAGYVCGSCDREIHQISNFQAGDRVLITLHVYSPPLAQMNNYVDEDSSSVLYSCTAE